MKSFLAMAIESHGGKEEEKEYSYFVKLTQAQLNDIIAMEGAVVGSTFSETKLPSENGLASRLRRYQKDGVATYELTTKEYHGEHKTKLETNDTLSEANYRSLMQLGISTNVRSRIHLPVYKHGEPVMKKHGPLQWEFDLYHVADDNQVSAWAKVELEVDVVAFGDIIDLIPFAYDDLIPSDSSKEEDRAFIAHLYANVYDVSKNPTSAAEEDVLTFS
jgi:glutathione peroxidase-family protein